MDFIVRKTRGAELSESDLQTVVSSVADGRVSPEQLAAWVMAVYFKGLSVKELSTLVSEIVFLGNVWNLTGIGAPKVDFRSVGNLGDPCALVLAPLTAACGAVVPVTGDDAGLGISGNLTALQVIPGFRIDLSVGDCVRQLEKVRCCFFRHSKQEKSALEVLNKTQRTIGIRACIPLLINDILCRALSVGIENIVLGIGGKSRLFDDKEAIRDFANTAVRTMRSLGHRCVAVSDNLPQPLGNSVGAVFELGEAVELLHGRGDPNLQNLIIRLGMEMVRISGVCGSTLSAKKTVTECLNSGSAFETFKAAVEAQGGDVSYLEHPEKLPKAEHVYKLQAEKGGYVHSIDVKLLKKGLEILMQPDASGKVDPTIGICSVMKPGAPVVPGDTLLEIHYNDPSNLETISECFRSAYCLTTKRPVVPEFEIERFA